jgi:hypothetical protein
LRLGLGRGGFVALGGAELEEDVGILEVARELLDALDVLLDRSPPPPCGLGLLGVVPETRRKLLRLQALELCLQLGKVKDAPLAP